MWFGTDLTYVYKTFEVQIYHIENILQHFIQISHISHKNRDGSLWKWLLVSKEDVGEEAIKKFS